jgi:protein-disulfide isomerase
MSGTSNNEKDNDDDSIRIKRSTFNKIALGAVATLAIATFFGGYILGGINAGLVGGGGSTSIAGTPEEEGGGSDAVAPTQQAPSGDTAPTPAAPQPAAPPTRVESISLDGAITKGKQGAPVRMVEFSDFQCPFCKRHFDNTLEQIEKEYVSTGKVQYVYKHYPLDFHPNAKSAAVAAECANEQGKFWEYHDVLFEKQTEWETQDANASATTFKTFATDLKLDTNKFNSCLDANKYEEKVDKELQEGSTYGVSGTPTFYIGNEQQGYTPIVGAQPFTTIKQTIDQLLPEGG